MTERIFLSAPDVRHLEAEYVQQVIESNWVAPAGPALFAFETDLAAQTERAHAVALSSGTAALHLALLELGVQPGDTVLCSSLTFAGSVNPIKYCGAEPILVDSEMKSWNADPALVEMALADAAATGQLPSAAIIVDVYGNCADYGAIEPILESYGVPMIEDAAEALGGTLNGRAAGSFGRHAILSFNGNKIITSSGGGAFVTDSEDAADRVRYLSTQARQDVLHYEHTEVGYNYRMSSLCAAVGRAQLATLDERIQRRTEINEMYRGIFAQVPGVQVLQPPSGTTPNNWLTVATLDPKTAPITSTQLLEALDEANIESRPVWKPMHLQPVFADVAIYENGTSQWLFENGICLPSGSGMTEDDLSRIQTTLDRTLIGLAKRP